jgi:hypothetical protein
MHHVCHRVDHLYIIHVWKEMVKNTDFHC